MTIGTRVLLLNCPHGEPGIVRALSRGRVEVEWPDLQMTTRHKPERLVVVDAFRNQFVSEREDSALPTAKDQPIAGLLAPGILERGSERGASWHL